jgi:hypothetical protein
MYIFVSKELSENLFVERIWLWRESGYRGDYMRSKIKETIEFRM